MGGSPGPASTLYVPGHRRKLIAAGLAVKPGSLILDLEDSVPREEKASARSVVDEALSGLRPRATTLVVRINALADGGVEDLERVPTHLADAVLVPKVETERQLAAVADKVWGRPIWVMIETPAAVLAAPTLARSDRVAALVVGYGDLAKSFGIEYDPLSAPLRSCAMAILTAGAAAGVPVIDGVELGPPDRIAASTLRARTEGFAALSLIRPSDVPFAARSWSMASVEGGDAYGDPVGSIRKRA